MHKIETELSQKSPLKPKFFKRLIDDIFLIWNHGEATLQEFLRMINSHHSTIKFTEEISTTQIPFLDTIVYKEDGKLLTKVYHKKTDQKQYLHYHSSDPRNQKDVVPHVLQIRVCIIYSKDQDFKIEATNIITSLLKRGYLDEILHTAFTKACPKPQSELLETTLYNKIRLVTTYN